MSAPAEQAVRDWANSLPIVGQGNPVALGFYLLSQRSPADGAYGVVLRNPEGVPGGPFAEGSAVSVARIQFTLFAGTTEASENAAVALREQIDRLDGMPERCGKSGWLVLVTDNRNGPFAVNGTSEAYAFQVGADFTLRADN